MNNFETTQRIKDGLPNQIRQNIEEVKIATKKIIKNNSKLGFFKDKDLIDIKDLILKGSISKEMVLSNESRKVLDFVVNYDAAIMKFAYDNHDLFNPLNKVKVGFVGKSINIIIALIVSAIVAFICFGLLYGVKETASDPGKAVMLFVIFGIVIIPFAIVIFLTPFKVLRTLLEANIVGGIKECFLTDKKMPDLPNNVFECRLEIFLRFLESTRSMAQFEILLNQAQLNNVDLIVNANHITNTEKMQLIESILSQQRTCMNHFDMIYFDMEKEKLYKKIYNKEPAKNFIYKWFELTKRCKWVGIIFTLISLVGGGPLVGAIILGIIVTAITGVIFTIFYYLVNNKLFNKNIENRIKVSQIIQQYLNEKKENLIKKIQNIY